MKIYLFCPETGLYQGEDFADAPPLCPGREALPPYATTVAPPPYGRGEVPVFSLSDNAWGIRAAAQFLAGGCADRYDRIDSCDETTHFPKTCYR